MIVFRHKERDGRTYHCSTWLDALTVHVQNQVCDSGATWTKVILMARSYGPEQNSSNIL